jgi:putative ABC transport system substrate-binding protein
MLDLRRRQFITLLGGAAAAWPLVARAQAPRNIPRLCFLTFDPSTPQLNRFDPFFQGLRDLGYANGQDIVIDYLSAEGNGERFPALVAECLRLKADVIAVSTTPAAQAAIAATRSIPIIMIGLGDPVRTRLVNSLAQPGGNVTGLSLMVPEVAAKRLGLLKEAIPGISRVLVLTYLADPIAPLQVKALEEAAPSLGVTLQVLAQGARVTELAARYKLPAMYCYSTNVADFGGLMAYDVSYPDVIRRAASYVDRILKGAKASALPVEQPTKFEFVVNLRTAKALALDMPPTLLARADEVIE